MKKQKVVVIGLGYVGLPLAIAIQKSRKYDLFGLDRNEQNVSDIKRKKTRLEDIRVKEELKKYPLKATTDKSVLKDTDIFIIAVPTPVRNDKSPDYRPVKSASKSVAKYLRRGATVVLESTVNPGTCEEVVLPILEEKSGLTGGRDFNLTHCPERINPGDPKWNVYNIPRNIGSLNQRRNKEIANFYRSFLRARINEVSNLKVAESTKIIENAFRDINIAYVNELAQSFDAMGIDLVETIEAASNKPFGYMPHWPGAGVGGHCIAVDPYYLIKRAEKANFNHKLLKMARKVNNSMPEYTVERLKQGLREAGINKQDAKVAVLGMSYKPEVVDLRESPSLDIISILKKKNFKVIRFDPYLLEYSDTKTLNQALIKTNSIILATAHKQLRNLKAEELKKHGIKVVIDGRNALNKQKMVKSGIIYKGIGR